MGKTDREIIRIAVPAAAETLFTTLVGIIDSKMVSALGLNAIAAISVTNQPKLFLLCLFFALNTSLSSLVAKNRGKKDRERANEIAVTAFALAAGAGLLLGLLCVLLARPVMILCSNQPETLADSVLYFRIVMGGMFFHVLSMAVNAAFRGSGDTHLTLISNGSSCIVNLLLNYLLIEGHLGAPALGIAGAAIATLAGSIAGAAVSLAFAFRKAAFVSLALCRTQRLRPGRSACLDLAGLWKRIFAEDVFTRIGFLLTGIIAARAGSLAMSVYSVSMHLLNINFAFGSGLSTAAIALVGKSHGAGDREALQHYCRRLLRFGTLASLMLAAVYLPCSGLYCRLFSSDGQFIRSGILSCAVLALLSPIQNRQIVYNGIFRAMGEVKYTLRAAVISVTLVNTAVSFVTTVLLSWGLWGIWAGAFANQSVRMLLLRRRYLQLRQRGDREWIGKRIFW